MRFANRLLAITVLMLLVAPANVSAQSMCSGGGSGDATIVLDGQFADWAGRACIPDPVGDCSQDKVDLTALSFGSNPDDPTAYFMAQRLSGGSQPVGLLLAVDTNNDGVYTEPTDRVIAVHYRPRSWVSEVDVELRAGDGTYIAELASGANWGESVTQGGQRVEWGVSFGQLGIAAGQAIRMRLSSMPGNTNGNSVCDESDEVQWSPADVLGYGLLAVAVLAGVALMARRRASIL